jgi:hypothetical protein
MSGYASGVDIIDIFAGGHLDQQSSGWLQEQSQFMSTGLSHTAQQFFEQARNMYQVISQTDALQVIRNVKAKVGSLWGNDVFAATTLPQIQTANPVMQRWIMALPELRTMYLNQEVEGYGDSYQNFHGHAVGADHYDWRQVMTDVVVVKPNEWGYTNYCEPTSPGEKPLTLHEKVDILATWNAVKHYLDEADEDPTSTCGAKLG